MLTDKKKRWADIYMMYYDKIRATREAGYSAKTPVSLSRKAQSLSEDPDIKHYIAEETTQRNKAEIIKKDEILKYLSNIIRGIEKENTVFVLRSGCKEGYSDEIKYIDCDIKARDRLKATELLMKSYGMLISDSSKDAPQIIIKNNIPRPKK